MWRKHDHFRHEQEASVMLVSVSNRDIVKALLYTLWDDLLKLLKRD